MKLRLGAALVLALWVGAYMTVRPVYAYLDPGTGSFLFQLLVSVAVGGLFMLKVYWKRIKGFFVKNQVETDDNEIEL